MSDNHVDDKRDLDASRQLWDAEAASFDEQPDHGLRDPLVLQAWTELTQQALPATRGRALDIGCGTGSLSIVLAGLGYTVTGIDFSPEMIAQAEAKAKASGYAIEFHIMDGANPQFPPQQFDVILCRHLLWTLPEPHEVLERWVKLLKPNGRLMLIEGFWHTGAGLHTQSLLDMLPAALTNVVTQNLSDQPALWGRDVEDERYVIWADRQG
jgi:2-polyprenyl-3-methyl-5-hydroxy-6-metoxy-1,4-benzoquinol methylase